MQYGKVHMTMNIDNYQIGNKQKIDTKFNHDIWVIGLCTTVHAQWVTSALFQGQGRFRSDMNFAIDYIQMVQSMLRSEII